MAGGLRASEESSDGLDNSTYSTASSLSYIKFLSPSSCKMTSASSSESLFKRFLILDCFVRASKVLAYSLEALTPVSLLLFDQCDYLTTAYFPSPWSATSGSFLFEKAEIPAALSWSFLLRSTEACKELFLERLCLIYTFLGESGSRDLLCWIESYCSSKAISIFSYSLFGYLFSAPPRTDVPSPSTLTELFSLPN